LIRYIDAHISIPQWREVLELIDPEWEDQLQDLLELAEDYLIDNVEPLPDDFTNGEGGARLKGTVGPVDMAISYLYIWDDYPVIHLNPEAVKLINALFDPVGTGVGIFQIDIEKLDPPFKGLYHRLHVAGLEFSLTLGDFAFRAEGTYNHNRYTYNNRFDAIKADTITYVAGLEYTFFGSWITVLQFLHTHYLDYEEGMLGSENYYLPMLILRKSFLDDRLEFQGGIIYDCTYLTQDEVDDWDLFGEDYMITPILVYSVSDPLKVSLGANIFGGDEFNLFGYFRENTQVWLSTKYSF